MKPLQADEIEFDKYSSDVGRVVRVRRQGKLYTVAGADIALFPLRVLCEAIGRDQKTVRRWETEGYWPKSQWKVPDNRCKHWYSARQILRIHELHAQFSKGDWGFSHSPYFPLVKFFNAVREEFYLIDAKSVMQGASNG